MIEPDAVGKVVEIVFLTKLREQLFVLWKKGCFINLCFPEEVPLIHFLLLSNFFTTQDIDCILWLNAKCFCWLLPCSLSLEGFVYRTTSKLQILLDLITRDELRGTYGIEGS